MRASPLSLASSAVLILCLNLGRTYAFHCRKKKQAGFEMVVALKVLCQNYMTLCVRIVK